MTAPAPESPEALLDRLAGPDRPAAPEATGARDPRREPRAGDVLWKDGVTREVRHVSTHVTAGVFVEYIAQRDDGVGRGRYRAPWLRTWQRWAKRAEVVHTAEVSP